jgi:hypothetical protein
MRRQVLSRAHQPPSRNSRAFSAAVNRPSSTVRHPFCVLRLPIIPSGLAVEPLKRQFAKRQRFTVDGRPLTDDNRAVIAVSGIPDMQFSQLLVRDEIG